jgi:hypothetical protein
MSWFSLKAEGYALSGKSQTEIARHSGNYSLTTTLERLNRLLEEGLTVQPGEHPGGLQSALVVQVALARWDSWTSYRSFEQGEGVVLPPMELSVIAARTCGSCSQGRSSRPGSPGSSLN